jgi:glycosyltransferase involved in cell wall biosynthesis
MKVSIITVSYNSEKTINDTLQSIKSQVYKDIELIIIDGGSIDGTLKVIHNYADIISYYKSEPDKGIYDAMNKGLSVATGEIIGFLNSDDFYPSKDVILNVVKNITFSKADAVYSNLNYVHSKKQHITRVWKSSKPPKNAFQNSWVPPHPTFFAKKYFYDEVGEYDRNFKYAADFDLLLRFFINTSRKIMYCNETWVHMREGGTTNNNLKVIFLQNKEILDSLSKAGINHSVILFIFKKIHSRLMQRILSFSKRK